MESNNGQRPDGKRRGGNNRGIRNQATVTTRPRLTTPMVRDDGVLRPATWDEALARAANGFASVKEQHGPEAIGMFSCSKSTNEMNFAAQKFARTVLGTNNIDSCNRT